MLFWLFSGDSYAVNSVSQRIFTTGLISLLAEHVHYLLRAAKGLDPAKLGRV